MNPPPEDLLRVYDAHINANFTAWPKEYNRKTYSPEQISQITYIKIEEEQKNLTHSVHPLTWKCVLGPLTRKEKEEHLLWLQKELPEIENIKESTQAEQIYLLISGLPWVISLLDHLPKNILLQNSSIYRLSLSKKPDSFPDQIFMCKYPTKTLTIFNMGMSTESFLEAFTEFQIEKIVTREKAVYICMSTVKTAESLYDELAGTLLEHCSIFIMYYPDCLSEVNLFL